VESLVYAMRGDMLLAQRTYDGRIALREHVELGKAVNNHGVLARVFGYIIV
jgi:hypothetical protein